MLAVGLAWAVPLPAALGARPCTVIEYRDGSFAHVLIAPDGRWRVPIALDEIDPAYLDALLALEDRRFRWHAGVDPLAAARAAVANLAGGRVRSGASTLTMQLVRMLEPRPRTLRSKLVEAARAVQLELRLSKREILAAYLERVPYGRNLEGVESASLAFFGHRATHLSAAEIATLLAVPQAPAQRRPSPERATILRAARDGIAARLAGAGALPLGEGPARRSAAEVLDELVRTPAPVSAHPFPREAPHAARWIAGARPDEIRIRTTLDPGAQRIAERVLAAHREGLARDGIWNGAVAVADPGTGELLALAGNLAFDDAAHAGQIAAFARPRSPGSALKPLVYALAIDRGLAGPDALVPDVPRSYGGYEPRNFDGTWSGLVRLEDALSRSLNVPFVALLQRVGVEPFLGTLERIGVTSLRRDPGHYGLSAAVGGLELTPLELLSLYATLANGGRAVPLHAIPGPAPAREILSPGAAWLTARALALRDRPDFPERRRHAALPPGVAWKTGTSFGFRDAWAAGFTQRFAAVVWLGNLDRTPSVHLVGADAAGPVLFDVLEALDPRSPPQGPAPAALAEVEVCAYSGHLPTEACPHRKVVLAPRRAVPTEPCPYHVALEVEVATGRAVAPGCRAGRATERRTYVVWPASVRRWLSDQERRLPSPPLAAAGCAAPAGAPPVLLSPGPSEVVLMLPGVDPADQEIPLEAEAPGTARLSWFVDGAYLGTASAEERVWWRPRPGRHEVLVADEAGRSARRAFEVRERR